MPKNRETVSIEKHPTKGNNGTWVLRDAKTGKFTEVRTSEKSQQSISKSAKENSGLLDRLAKR